MIKLLHRGKKDFRRCVQEPKFLLHFFHSSVFDFVWILLTWEELLGVANCSILSLNYSGLSHFWLAINSFLLKPIFSPYLSLFLFSVLSLFFSLSHYYYLSLSMFFTFLSRSLFILILQFSLCLSLSFSLFLSLPISLSHSLFFYFTSLSLVIFLLLLFLSFYTTFSIVSLDAAFLPFLILFSSSLFLFLTILASAFYCKTESQSNWTMMWSFHSTLFNIANNFTFLFVFY